MIHVERSIYTSIYHLSIMREMNGVMLQIINQQNHCTTLTRGNEVAMLLWG